MNSSSSYDDNIGWGSIACMYLSVVQISAGAEDLFFFLHNIFLNLCSSLGYSISKKLILLTLYIDDLLMFFTFLKLIRLSRMNCK